jgi:hypothetical protein
LKHAGKFVRESYERNDLLGRQLLIAFLHKQGHEILPISFEETKGIDIYTRIDGREYHYEAEMKHNYAWTDMNSFRFDTVSFLERKMKWASKNFWYVIICGETKAAIFAQSNKIYQPQYKQSIYVNTSERQGRDGTYRPPKEICKFLTPQEFFDEDYVKVYDKLKNPA